MGELTGNTRRTIFERMLLMRRFEEMVATLSAEKEFTGHFHLYIGQEATGAALMEVLGPDDRLVTTHRNHGHLVGRGADPGRVLAEILGRAGGTNRGRGGTLHACDHARGFLSTSAIVGGTIGLATGGAFALAHQPGNAICVGLFGDGALEEGVAFETMNLAALWSLPVLFVCENNSVDPATMKGGDYSSSLNAAKPLSDIPRSLGIATEAVDGADVDAVHTAAARAVDRMRAERGPAFIEAVTERWPGTRPLWPALLTGITDLTMAWDDARIGGEHAGWIRDHDPVLRCARTLLGREEATREEILAMDARAAARMAQARAFALESPFPDPDEVLDGVFA